MSTTTRINQKTGAVMTVTTVRKASPAETAAQAYSRNHVRAQRALEELVSLLAVHSDVAASDPRNYGYVGDLAHIATLLEQAVDFIHPDGSDR